MNLAVNEVVCHAKEIENIELIQCIIMYRLETPVECQPAACVWISNLTRALEAIPNPPWGTFTFKVAGCIGAGCVCVAVVGSNLTLIDI